MSGLRKFYRKTVQERWSTLYEKEILTEKQVEYLKDKTYAPEFGDSMIENYITDYTVPEGLSFHYLIDGREYLVPMVTEEPSVIAASSHGAGLVKKAGGFKTRIEQRLMIGQILLENCENYAEVCQRIEEKKAAILEVANKAHYSLVKRGGGARWLRCRQLADDLMSIDMAVDVQEAMGANMLNTMLEAAADYIHTKLDQNVLLSILSNYATECLAVAECSLPLSLLGKNGLTGEEIGRKIAQASRVAQLDPYRAATHNKGIMNGIDAVVMATGNDWRAIESGAHAFAARSGQYRGLSKWKVSADQLKGRIELPLPVGTVGGSIGILPLVKINQKILGIRNATELERVIACVGLSQNLAALYALISEGIQRGHMRLQAKSLAIAAGAKPDELFQVLNVMRKNEKNDLATAKAVVARIRRNR
ncbi:hydroxymethylglutaryl-CoA reductase [Liquorilactobacillus sucicola DSM 21376 = JCM 15457]|uniref:3-hydroxy-3-methylglutaryl coenzyme A reductase n=1 Tax=Liquorilactobacillus sucicola DSM 21376 = JCM 15457 TaxID=1423806 RepID=A0A023D0H1_9LACO|nr:hydroxymethylglutaryl-CoA reductase, degradative [Liquorilactobacillus sucicola]KRN07192.1 3-hydroxy-3-methylglutaryl-coenzyme a reductase [Liquorilactobacillus sucicola DSM 21376 = JCM 15457]GAJ27321.1 hydroxymethylglutaryl-CoA reductase [Liquorilactobacillus sucicola DSM 21376 = JCM 15457]